MHQLSVLPTELESLQTRQDELQRMLAPLREHVRQLDAEAADLRARGDELSASLPGKRNACKSILH